MASRAELVLRACASNVDHTLAKYSNDSVLEQAVLYAEGNLTATSTATTLVAPALKGQLSGGKDV